MLKVYYTWLIIYKEMKYGLILSNIEIIFLILQLNGPNEFIY
jgi:hypothetical protein